LQTVLYVDDVNNDEDVEEPPRKARRNNNDDNVNAQLFIIIFTAAFSNKPRLTDGPHCDMR